MGCCISKSVAKEGTSSVDAAHKSVPSAAHDKFFQLGQASEDSSEILVYHCTSMEAAQSIQKEGFRFPVKGVTENRGWKLGYAVYFGRDPKYCVHEALNTFESL